MHIIITLKDGSEHSLLIFRLTGCGIYKNTFFIETQNKGRIEFPIDSLSGFRVEASRGRAWEGDSTILNPAI
ncbi:unnamed protein product, partial [marine sediment metagenome]